MSGIEDQGSRPENVTRPTDGDAEARIARLAEERTADGAGVDDVPAGGGGADSGGSAAVGVDEGTQGRAAEEADSYDSEHNDEPGIGNRRPD